MLKDVETLVLRGAVGGLMAGHGSQKLFGAFDGPGLKGTAGFMESLGLQPGHYWGTAAALSEFGGGTLTALGFLYPLGPIGVMSSMGMAWGKAHWGKPIWGTAGGAELPLTNIAVSLALVMAGPGKYSLDRAFGIKLPGWVGTVAALTAAGAVAYGLSQSPAQQTSSPAQQSGATGDQAAASEQPGPSSGEEAARQSASGDSTPNIAGTAPGQPSTDVGGGDASPV